MNEGNKTEKAKAGAVGWGMKRDIKVLGRILWKAFFLFTSMNSRPMPSQMIGTWELEKQCPCKNRELGRDRY